MFNPLGLLPEHLVLDLLLSSQLLLHQLSLLLLLGLQLLATNHLLQRVVLQMLLMFHHVHKVLLFTLLLFNVVNVSSDLFLHVSLISVNICSHLFLDRPVLRLSERLLLFLLTLYVCSLLRLLHVSLSRLQNVRRPLLRLVELLPRLHAYSLYVTLFSSCLRRAMRLESSL